MIIKFIKQCDVCQRMKKLQRKFRASLKPIHSSYPFALIHIDVIGPLTCTQDGNRYLIVIIDHFSKFVEAIAVKDFTALTTAKFIINQIICRYGTPSSICSDLGVNFEAELFKYLCELLKIKKLRSTAYHPQTNGEVERVNRTLKQLLKCYVNEQQNNWDQFVNQMCCAINTSVNESTNKTPFEILFGKEFAFPQNISHDNNTNDVEKTLINEYLHVIKSNKERLQQIVQIESQKAIKKQKRNYDKSANENLTSKLVT
jgi:hypothetical protein